MSLPTLSEFKRGDTFSLVCIYKVNGVPTSLSGITIRSQLRRTNKTLVANLIATVANQSTDPGKFTLTSSTNTQTWPLESLVADIELIQGGTVRSSQTFVLPVTRDITLPVAP